MANETRFLLGLTDGCVPRPLAVVQGTLRNDPPFTMRRRDEGDLETLVANAKRDHCCLSIQSGYFAHVSPTGCCLTLWSVLVHVNLSKLPSSEGVEKCSMFNVQCSFVIFG